MLHRTNKMLGFHIHARDGQIGHVDDFLVDEGIRTVHYLVVDTRNWIGGRSVLISAAAIERVDSVHRKMYVNLSRDEVERGPSMATADLVPAENLPTIWLL